MASRMILAEIGSDPAVSGRPGARQGDDGGCTMVRAWVNEVLNVSGADLQVTFGPLFNQTATEAQKEAARKAVAGRRDWLERRLADGQEHLAGADFTIADAYAFDVANWANITGIVLSRWQNLLGFMARAAAGHAALIVATGLAGLASRPVSGDRMLGLGLIAAGVLLSQRG